MLLNKMMPITPIYAAILGLVFVVLSIRTLLLRRQLKVEIGDGDQPMLARAARVHANFAEYVPLSLILIYFLEIQTQTSLWIHFLCSVSGNRTHYSCVWGQPSSGKLSLSSCWHGSYVHSDYFCIIWLDFELRPSFA